MSTTTATRAPGTGAADAADTAAAVRLAETVGRLVRMLRRAHVGSLGPASAAALATLVRNGPTRLGELAEIEGVTPAALSRVVASLERGKLVRRRSDPADRRSSFVSVTAAGRQSMESLMAGRAAVLAERIAALDPADRDALMAGVTVLERLVATDPAPRS